MSAVFKKIVFGPLPVDLIEFTLGHELDPGDVVISVGAQYHALRNHPEDFWDCYIHLAQIIETPLYLGDDLRNAGKIEFVGRATGSGVAILVAIELERDGDGVYNVCSFYTLKETTVENRKTKGRLKVARRK